MREAEIYYNQWKTSTPLERVQIKAELPMELMVEPFVRTEQRGVALLLRAVPLEIKQLLVSNRDVSSTAILWLSTRRTSRERSTSQSIDIGGDRNYFHRTGFITASVAKVFPEGKGDWSCVAGWNTLGPCMVWKWQQPDWEDWIANRHSE